jgi:tRNA(fMet)-specific endonuclease VapC
VILLDTNVFLGLLKGDAAVGDWLKRIPRSELGVPAIVVYELEYGSLKARFSAKRRDILRHGMEQIEHVPFDTDAALETAKIRIQLERQRASHRTLGSADCRDGRKPQGESGDEQQERILANH